MNANERELLGKDEVYAIVSCAFEILNGIGHGFHEKPYEKIIIDTKTIDFITPLERGKCSITSASPASRSASFSTSKSQNLNGNASS